MVTLTFLTILTLAAVTLAVEWLFVIEVHVFLIHNT